MNILAHTGPDGALRRARNLLADYVMHERGENLRLDLAPYRPDDFDGGRELFVPLLQVFDFFVSVGKVHSAVLLP